MGRRFLGMFLPLLVGALALPAVSLAGEDFNVTVTVGWENCYRPMEWTPIEINVANSKLKKPFGGTLLVSAQQDGLNKLTIGREFVLTRDNPVDCAMVTKFTYGVIDCRVRILNARGRTSWSTTFSLMDSSKGVRLVPVDDDALLIGVAGRVSSSLVRLGENSACQHEGKAGRVHVKRKILNRLPHDWTGYAGLDVLVLYDPDWNRLTVHQSRAIALWVTNGGRLLIVLGTRPLPGSGPIAALVPFRPGPLRQIRIPASVLGKWGCERQAGADVSCWPLDGAAQAGWDADGGKESFFACGPVGFGKVAVLGFDPYLLVGRKAGPAVPGTPHLGPRPVRSAGVLAKFWTVNLGRVLGSRQIRHQPGGWGGDSDFGFFGAFELGQSGPGSNIVLGHLMSIREMLPLSIWWVIGLLALLAVLLGPVDYLVLKRIGKLPLTWVTSTVWIALFSAGAFYGVQALRAGPMQVRVVSVIDAVEGSKAIWSTQYAGIFAPASRNYRLSGAGASEWWSAITPTRDEFGFGPERGIGARNIFCIQKDGGNRPTSVPINIMSMQFLLTEAPVEKMPFSASVEEIGDERLAVRIVNHSDVPIRRALLRLDGGRGIEFGALDAGESRRFTGRPQRWGQWDDCLSGGSVVTFDAREIPEFGDFETDSAYFARGCLRRTRAVRDYLRRGAAVVCVEYLGAPVSFGVAGRECKYSHLVMARMVVFPKRAGARAAARSAAGQRGAGE